MKRIAFNEEELIVLRGLVAIELDHNNSDLKECKNSENQKSVKDYSEFLNRLLKKVERKIQ